MLGALIDDIAGPVCERNNIKTKDFEPLIRPRAFFTESFGAEALTSIGGS